MCGIAGVWGRDDVPLLRTMMDRLAHRGPDGQGIRRQPGRGVLGHRRLAIMDPEDPAEVHFRLAQLLQKQKPAIARKHVLLALEAAPRFRAAHRLLLQLVNQQQGEANSRITNSAERSTDRRE